MRSMKLLFAAVFLLAGTAVASAQGCGGQFRPGTFCGNSGASLALPGPVSLTPAVLAPIAGGTVIGNPTGATAAPIATATPVLGVPGSVQGSIGLAGVTSGTATIKAQAAAGTPTLTLPNTSGTFAAGASAPLALSATTGNLSITGLTGGVLAGSGPAFTATPTLGVPGTTLGTLGLAGSASGTVTLTPQATAGTVTLTLPNASGTVADGASAPLVLNATTGAMSLTTPLALNYGGTAAALTASNGGIVYSTGSALAILAGTATANQILLSGSSAAPSWSTATYPATTTTNQLLYSSTTNTVAGLASANSSVLVTNGAGVPSLSTTLPAGLTIGNLTLSGTLTAGSLSTVGTIGGSICATAAGLVLYESGVNCFAVTASSITIGSTTINSGTSGYFLYQNGASPSGTIGELASTAITFGSGTLNLGGNLTTSGAFASTFTMSGAYTYTLPGATSTLAALTVADQTLSGGANVTSLSQSAGNITVDCGARPLQYITGSTSAWTITAPSNDGSCILLLSNPGSSVNIPAFSGFSVGTNTGDPLTATASSKFMISVARINGTSTYSVKALQ